MDTKPALEWKVTWRSMNVKHPDLYFQVLPGIGITQSISFAITFTLDIARDEEAWGVM